MPALVLAAVSCASAGDEAGHDAAYGVLGMGSLAAAVSEDAVSQAAATRAVDAGAFIVRILDYKQRVAGEWTYAERPAEITLPVGDYTLEVCSPALHDAEWESPWYTASENFTIASKSRTDLGNVTCRLGNVKVTVHYSEELKGLMNGDSQVSVNIAGNELLYSFTERRAGYFAVPDAEAGMEVVFEGTIDGVWDRYTHLVEGVKPGDWHRVRFTFEENDGFRTFLVTVYDSSAGQIGDGSEWF